MQKLTLLALFISSCILLSNIVEGQGSKEKSGEGLSKERSGDGGSKEKSGESGSKEKAGEGGSEERRGEKGNKEKSGEGLSKERSGEGGSKEKSGEGGSREQAGEGGSEEKSGEKGSKEKSGEGLSKERSGGDKPAPTSLGGPEPVGCDGCSENERCEDNGSTTYFCYCMENYARNLDDGTCYGKHQNFILLSQP